MSPVISNLLLKSTAETFYMLGVSALIAAVVGIPLGILLVVTEKNGILVCRLLNKPLAFVINMIRSIPFIILMVAIIPLTRLIAGTSIGTTAAIVPLTIAAIPYTARMVETSIREVPFGLIEAAESMGASPFQIIKKVLIPEALPSIIENITVVVVTLIGSSAMAGTIGGGGSRRPRHPLRLPAFPGRRHGGYHPRPYRRRPAHPVYRKQSCEKGE